MAGTIQRIKEFIDSQGFTVASFEKLVGFSNGSLASQIKNNKSIGVDKLENIVSKFPEISPAWLLKGEGPMLRSAEFEISKNPKPAPNAIPINIPQPGEEEDLELIKREDSTEFRHLGDDQYLVICPLVEQYAYAGYVAGWSDAVYVDDLPRHTVVMKNLTLGVYRSFEVRGDSMDNGLRKSFADGDILTGRKLYQKHWRSKLHIHKYKYFILVTIDGIQIKEIIDHKVDEGIIVCHSLNPDKEMYPDFELSLADVREIYYVKARTEPLD
ncbi:hypothetical protein [Dyadobacter fermentans]|uniref:Uncharacterized protein n=1 Tax=Dyadobacter fermentans (strain ATCC 700827 / DSM 18053 / CIP 107007 / KCTC 52180 / NS114) TaxID=471854 RepID=C6VVE8_DYAFD|nr:hypothetical protein [Dyadobacter fermentans]ACT96678.1 hypothetical protein Dfer_5487 [Dyadobacter fermentans DSM 18053]